MIELSPAEIALYYSVAVPKFVQRGRQWRGPCPIHQGDGLSFSVDPETGRAYCFSQCGRGWDMPGLHMEVTSLGFRDALQQIGSIIGRDLLANSPIQSQPRFSPPLLAEGGLFQFGLKCHLTDELERHKENLWAALDSSPLCDDAPLFSESVRELTDFLAQVEKWSPRDAWEALRDFRTRQPKVAAKLISEALQQQAIVADFISAIAAEECAA